MKVELDIITMAGHEYVLIERDGAPSFPHGELRDAEPPADAARRLVKEWTGTDAPKLELSDLKAAPGVLSLLFRALLTTEPAAPHVRAKRMGLPATLGRLKPAEVEESLKTSLAYKLTRT